MSPIDFEEVDGIVSKQCPKEPQLLMGLTGFQRNLLVVIEQLSDDQPNGVMIRQQLKQHHVDHGQLYQNLRELIEEGYINKWSLDGRTNMYRLTETGRTCVSVYSEWVADCSEDVKTGSIEEGMDL